VIDRYLYFRYPLNLYLYSKITGIKKKKRKKKKEKRKKKKRKVKKKEK